MFYSLRVLLSVSLTLALIWVLDSRIAPYPPIGKLLDPINGFWQNAGKEKPSAVQNLTLKGLKSSVKIYWDKHHIPHIVADNDHDLYMAQGYVTASHRLWQMNFQVRKTAGRLSEILGTITLELDRYQRRKGLGYAAEIMEQTLQKDSATFHMNQAYAQGVNAYIHQLKYKDYGIEYKLLDYRPERWSVYKSCLLMKEMADILSLSDRDIENSHLIAQLGKETFELLFADDMADPLAKKGTRFFSPDALSPPYDTLPLPYPLFSHQKIPSSFPLQKRNQHGSNQVVVGKKRSSNGKVLHSNEPDLDLNLPSIWYFVHLIGKDFQTMGGSLPGAPGVVIGCNDSIAWGLTNAERDLSDWYEIVFTDKTRKEYLYDEERYKSERVVEKIYVRNERVVYDTVVYTHHGPVVYDANFRYERQEKGVNMALRWTGHLPSNEFRGIYGLNRAKNYAQFVQSIADIKCPPQNISLATSKGDIALWVQGAYPIKARGQGKFVQDGSRPQHRWKGFISQAHHIHIKNPDEGCLSAANQAPADTSDYPYYIYSHNFEQYRGRRLSERLAAIQRVQVKDLMALQHDNFNLIAYESLPLMLDSLQATALSIEGAQYYEALRGWDYFNEARKEAPVYFTLWFEAFSELLWDEYHTWKAPKYRPSIYRTITLMHTQPYDFRWYDIVGTTQKETLGILIQQSYDSMVLRVEKWKQQAPKERVSWSHYKNTTLAHLLRIDAFGVKDIEVGGGKHIVNAVQHDHGPSLRLIVSLSPSGAHELFGIYPGSQSGHVGHASYGKWVIPWAKGEYLPLLFSRKTKILQQNASHTQILRKR